MSGKQNTIKGCEGCLTKEVCEDGGKPYYKEKYNIKCPCGMCLIKVICKDPCEDYLDFDVEIHNCSLEDEED